MKKEGRRRENGTRKRIRRGERREEKRGRKGR
jgi:hypothetical protein